MALQVAKRDDGLWPLGIGPGVMQRVTLKPDASYPTGGYALSGSQVGLSSAGGPANNGLHGVIFEGGNTAALGYVPYYNEQTGKFQILVSAAIAAAPAAAAPLAELGAGVDVSTLVYYAVYEGTGE